MKTGKQAPKSKKKKKYKALWEGRTVNAVTTTIRKYVWNLAFPKVPWASGKPAQLKRRSSSFTVSPGDVCFLLDKVVSC